MTDIMLIFFSATELALLAVVIMFFVRLRKSEAVITQVQAKQEEFISRLQFNAKLENELVATFEQRQSELVVINNELERRVEELNRLMKRADEFNKSPQFIRKIIISGHRAGRSTQELARETGLGADEVEMIIEQS